ncbi:MAG TPA: PHP domain-containing protein [Candidatus Acidoferrum sp.]|nr:PHP domain-containing protein [Candidatus Acidoferrum sp.]
MFADLHLHTNFSDGTYTPEELAGHGKRLGFRALALSDHDTLEGCERMAVACAVNEIEFIPAAELTAELDGHELHLLAYYVDAANARLLVELARFQEVRQNRIREMVAQINKLNVPLRAESVFEIANCRAPGRPHVARALVKQGFCHNLDEAFDRFLKKGKPAWVPKFKMSAVEAVDLVHQAGGVAVMAHPGLNRCDDLIPALADCGMDGLECFHTKHAAAESAHYLRMAEQQNLLVTGGSDCHGLSKGKPLIGGIKLPYWRVEELKKRAEQNAARAKQSAGLS